MTINLSLRYAGLLAIVISATACNHQNADTPAPTLLVTATTNATLTPTLVPVKSTAATPPDYPSEYVFDWENAPYVPNPTAETPVPAPWSDQAKRAFSDDIRYDYRKADGWELIHSTFSTRSIGAYQFITLYNKYRGLLRVYFYERANVASLQSNPITIQHVKTASSSPLLNFAEQAVVDVSQQSTSYTTIEPQALSAGTWYAFQFELAFNATQTSQSANSPYVDFELISDQINSVTLNGGKVLTTLPVGLHITGLSNYAGLPSYNGLAQMLLTGSASVASIQKAGQDVQALSNSLNQVTAGNVLSGIITAQSTTTSSLVPYAAAVQLTKPTDRFITLTAEEFVLPGGGYSPKPPYTPQYNEAPGVFYLDSKPVVTTQALANAYTYTLDVASVRYLFNPAVTNLADIKNIKQEIVATAFTAPEATPSANPTLYAGTTLSANQPLTVVGVRVSFDVVPRSGAAPVHIIKTFKADVKTR